MPLLISRSLDGDLGIDESTGMMSHLAVCEKCRRFMKSYSMQKELVAASFSEMPLPVEAVTSMIARNRRKTSLTSLLFHPYGLAGTGVSFLAAIAVVFFQLQPQRPVAMPPSILLESTDPSTMCIPFSSIVYYEEYAGNAVHSQFVKVAPQRSHFAAATAQQVAASYYESPLLGDNAKTVRPVRGKNSDF
jgi:hypothetical protein